MSHEIFIKIDGIAGESQQAAHKGWIDAIHITYGATQPTAMHTGGGGGVGRADFAPLTFSHTLDKSSPNLFLYCASGKHIPTVTVSVCKAGDGSQEFAKIIMSDVIVAGITPGGASGSGMTETVALSYSKIQISVKEQKADGSMGAAVHGNWDVKANAAC
ncbi:MAG: type VI secretion system tube protein Hcp [Azoarcus sp.]|jgi:type VI secretion system secreted protein Hcp|nr:type VI secretion system tube protein Hcp [Azoarcus sp.]